MQPKAFVGKGTISGPKIKVSIQPDATKPVALAGEYNRTTTYHVGDSFTEFRVKVIAEDEETMATAKSSCLTMRMWKSEGVPAKPPVKTSTLTPDTRRKNDKDGVFFFT